MEIQELQELIEAKLSELSWQLHSEDELRASWKEYTLYLDLKGQVQVWKGSVKLVELPTAAQVLAQQLLAHAREKALEEFAVCFKPAQPPAGTEKLLDPEEKVQ